MSKRKNEEVKEKEKEKNLEEAIKKAVQGAITEERIAEAMRILQEYKSGKQQLEQKTIENDKWWRSRHWELFGNNYDETPPVSAWLVNTILAKHADAMDAFPEANILPREEGDKNLAETLSSVIPVILKQNGFEKVYYNNWYDKLKNGTAIYGVFWDSSKLNGLGDISVKSVDILNLFWEPGIQDIQDSRNLFHVELVDNDLLIERYPELAESVSGGGDSLVAHYEYDDKVDTTKKSLVVDWYYKLEDEGRTILHYCKFCGNKILYASENETGIGRQKESIIQDDGSLKEVESVTAEAADGGWYAHGKYPFVMTSLFPIKGTPAGFGYIDFCKSPQEYIDKMNKAFLDNTIATATNRYFVRNDIGMNEKEFADLTKSLVHIEGSLDENMLKPIQSNSLSGAHFSMLNAKIDEMKETSGNRDVNNGGTTKGVTAASAIAAMQEEGSKLSRDMIKADRRDFTEIIYQIIELVRQFYTLPRQYRITGKNGAAEYVSFDNTELQVSKIEEDNYKLPIFDIDVTAQAESAYNKMAQNELAIQFYNLGFFNPAQVEQSLLCVEMMDFKGKGEIIRKLQEILEQKKQAAMLTAQMPQMPGIPHAERIPQPIKGKGGLIETNSTGDLKKKEHGIVEKARAEASERSEPR